jgi:hypothetical protein
MNPYVPKNISKNCFKRNPDASRNVIGVWTTAPRPCLLLIRRSSDQVISNILHVVKVVFHTHTIIYVQYFCRYLLPISGNILIFSIEFLCSQLFMTCSPSFRRLTPTVAILYLEEKSRIIWGIFLGPNAPKFTQISFIFIPNNPRKT